MTAASQAVRPRPTCIGASAIIDLTGMGSSCAQGHQRWQQTCDHTRIEQAEYARVVSRACPSRVICMSATICRPADKSTIPCRPSKSHRRCSADGADAGLLLGTRTRGQRRLRLRRQSQVVRPGSGRRCQSASVLPVRSSSPSTCCRNHGDACARLARQRSSSISVS